MKNPRTFIIVVHDKQGNQIESEGITIDSRRPTHEEVLKIMGDYSNADYVEVFEETYKKVHRLSRKSS